MNVEAFGYAVLSTAVGMGIVFFFLIVLSILMTVIRRLFDDGGVFAHPDSAAPRRGDPAPADGSTGGDGGEVAKPSGSPADELVGGVPRWVIAGAIAYLSEEEREYRPRAGAWAERSNG